MMAWGKDCSSWDDSIDYANMRQFDYEDIPDDDFVYTTWHENQSLSELFFFCLTCASHPTVELPLVTILHISDENQRKRVLSDFERERSALISDKKTNSETDALLAKIMKWASGS